MAYDSADFFCHYTNFKELKDKSVSNLEKWKFEVNNSKKQLLTSWVKLWMTFTIGDIPQYGGKILIKTTGKVNCLLHPHKSHFVCISLTFKNNDLHWKAHVLFYGLVNLSFKY